MPAWVMLSDLGSRQPHESALVALADCYRVSYLRIEHDGKWNKSLAFNTAVRTALRCLPAVTHVIQLDADMILHPRLLAKAEAELRTAEAFCCLPRNGPAGLRPWTTPGDPAGFDRMLGQCGPPRAHAVGGFMVFPGAWLADQRGFEEGFTGWGHEDSELWLRARRTLRCRKDRTGSMLIHQWHPPQPGAGEAGPNYPRYVLRLANPAMVANPSGWGNGKIAKSVLRPGIARASRRPVLPAMPSLR